MKKSLIILIFLALSLTISAQIDLEIGAGMSVETTGNLVLEISGDLIENSNSYFKGTVSSGDRGSISSFAGLTLASGSVNKITRTTGSTLSVTSPKTSLRSYELENLSGQFTADVTSEFVPSGTNDESNGIRDKFVFTKQSTNWTGYSDNGSTSTLITGNDVSLPDGVSNLVIAEGVGVGATVFLEGPYTSSSSMANTINASIPTTSPYTEAPRTVASVPADAVDWILLELRSGTAASSSLGFRSAFIDINGDIIGDDGSPNIGMPADPGNYYLVVKHRNHLGIMTNSTSTYNWLSNP